MQRERARFLVSLAVATCLVAGVASQEPVKYSESALHDAAFKGDLQGLVDAIRDGADVNAPEGRFGRTALEILCSETRIPEPVRLEAVKYLFEAGGTLAATTGHGRVALASAAATGDLQLVQLLVDAGATMSHEAVLSAARSVEYERGLIDLLIAHGANLSAQQDSGFTPLTLALYVGNIDGALELVEAGADVNRPTNDRRSRGKTPLMLAARARSADAARAILDAGAPVDARGADGTTALMEAAARRADDVVTLLLSRGADPNATDVQGRTVLNCATTSDESSEFVMGTLLDNGADPLVNADANIHGSARNFRALILPRLIKGGIDVDMRNQWGDTPLHTTIKVLEVKPSLLEMARLREHIQTTTDADLAVELRDYLEDLEQRFEVAIEAQAETVRVLLEQGADVNAPGADGRRPLAIALERENERVVGALRDKGAIE